MGKLRSEQRSKITEKDRQQAAELIEGIREQNGDYEELLKSLEGSKTGTKLEKTLSSLKQKANKGIILVSEDLHSKSGGYIYELIQNADDCEYSIAQDEGDTPTLHFHLTDKRLTVTSNEDGFSADNVRSICDMGNSSKTPGQHTGQKGIGFKSVFAAAQKVHVRSDPYSFSFTPEQGGPNRGLSLVLPRNEKSQELTDEQGTRLILYQYLKKYEERMSELRDLNSFIMLFLKKLRKIVIHIDTQEVTEEISYVRQDEGVTRKITKTISQNGSSKSFSQRYIIKSRDVQDLPADLGIRQASSGRVELAFRIGSDGQPSPVTYRCRAYVCLPVEDFDFKFDVNADFDVVANRETLQWTVRNTTLMSEIAKAFSDQVYSFAKEDSDLKFSWLRYYSFQVGHKWFEKELQKTITAQLQKIRLFWSRNRKGRFLGRDVYYLPDCYCDDDGDPLFDDGPEQYLAKEYSDEILGKLKRLGVKQLSLERFLTHVAQDLDKKDSRIKNQEDGDNDPWHQKVTEILLQELKRPWATESKKTIKALKFIPLTNKRWVSYEKGIFFDSSSPESVAPAEVKLKIVRHSALPMKNWNPVFKTLGISPVERSDIVDKIKDIHRAYAVVGAEITKKQIKEHLRYMFLNNHETQMLCRDFWFFNHLGENFQPLSDTTHRLYFKDDVDKLSCFTLLKSHNSPGVQFLHPELADLFPHGDVNRQRTAWTKWLEANVNIRSAPVILVRPKEQKPQLSPEFIHIMKKSPEKIIMLLWQNWSSYRDELKEFGLDEELLIQDIQIPTAGGLKCPISESYLPTKDLLLASSLRGIKGPLLSELQDLLDSTSPNTGPTKLLVKRLGVREELDVDFLVKALMELKHSKDPAQVDEKIVKDIYRLFRKRCDEKLQDPQSREKLRETFEEHSLIFYRDPESQAQQWLPRSKCLWDEDDGLYTNMKSIRAQYPKLTKLFRTYLELPEPSLHMYVNTLQGRLGDYSEENMRIIKRILVKISGVLDDDELTETHPEDSSPGDSDEDSGNNLDSSSEIDDEESSEDGTATASTGSNNQTHENDERSENDESDGSSENDDSSASTDDSKKGLENDIQRCNAAARVKLKRSDFEFLPLRDTDGTYRLASCKAKFVIPDYYGLKDDFKDDVPMLDLNLEEIIDCSKLIKILGLNPKRLSELGESELEKIDPHKDAAQTKIFRGKAAAFCGCLRHFTKKKNQRLQNRYDKQLQRHYDRLSNVQISQCREISQRFCLEFDSKLYEGTWRPAWFHVEWKKRSGHIFVPSDEKEREFCDSAEFPKEMIDHLHIEDPEARSVITMIVRASTDQRARILMQNANIPLWPAEELDDESEETDEQNVEQQDPSSGPSVSDHDEDLQFRTQSSISVTSKWSSQLPTRTRADEVYHRDQGYVDILQHVVQEARTIEFPQNGSVALTEDSGYPAAVRFRDIFEKDRWIEEKRHFKVGAAGELFVFKFLERILPDFGLDNWTSTIRHYVSVLEEFASIDEWEKDRETTDFQYQDDSGTLTKLLLEMKYIAPGSVTKHPNYFIEVKTSVGKCKDRFHMSDEQYDLMKENAMDKNTKAAQIYMLLRVFQVDHDRIGLRVFVDPWAEDGESLRFEPSIKWTVYVEGS